MTITKGNQIIGHVTPESLKNDQSKSTATQALTGPFLVSYSTKQ